MKACEVCGTEVKPPFHSFCSHDCVAVVAGRKRDLVQIHTGDGHGAPTEKKTQRLSDGTTESTGGLLSPRWETAVDGTGKALWHGPSDLSWHRAGGRQERAYFEASKRTREEGRGTLDVWPTQGVR